MKPLPFPGTKAWINELTAAIAEGKTVYRVRANPLDRDRLVKEEYTETQIKNLQKAVATLRSFELPTVGEE